MRPVTKMLASMTGYARTTGNVAGCRYEIEIKSVNGRGLDQRMRLSQGLDALEPVLRRILSERLSRGSVNFNASFQREGGGAEIVINQQALGAVLDALDALAGKVEADRPRLDGILGLRGVLDVRENTMSAEVQEAVQAAIIEATHIAIDDLIASRRVEGDRLKSILMDRLDEMEELTAQAEAHPSRTPEAITAKLQGQIATLGEETGLSDERLHQEAMLLATKADIREELDRLKAHVQAARQLVADGGAIGRKLDFLSQEFNREANTLCSKSNAVDLTSIGLELKSVIDQFREQVQNIE